MQNTCRTTQNIRTCPEITADRTKMPRAADLHRIEREKRKISITKAQLQDWLLSFCLFQCLNYPLYYYSSSYLQLLFHFKHSHPYSSSLTIEHTLHPNQINNTITHHERFKHVLERSLGGYLQEGTIHTTPILLRLHFLLLSLSLSLSLSTRCIEIFQPTLHKQTSDKSKRMAIKWKFHLSFHHRWNDVWRWWRGVIAFFCCKYMFYTYIYIYIMYKNYLLFPSHPVYYLSLPLCIYTGANMYFTTVWA